MKWLFCLYSRHLLRIIKLFLLIISIGCTRTTPRYEPPFLGYDDVAPKHLSKPKTGSKGTQNQFGYLGPDPCLERLSSYLNDSKDDLTDLLKDIGYSKLLEQLSSRSLTYSKALKKEVLILHISPNSDLLENSLSKLVGAAQAASGYDSKAQSTLLASHTLPDKLSVLFDRDGEAQSTLVGVETLTINGKARLSHSEKYALTAFVLKARNRSSQLIAFIKSNGQWCYYNDREKNSLNNQKAIDLASKYATLFFYQKIAG